MNEESFPLLLVALLIAGFFIGGIAGFWSARDTASKFYNRETLRAECIRGNERACRVYAVDYHDGGVL